jgi:ankyrin repeat protein
MDIVEFGTILLYGSTGKQDYIDDDIKNLTQEDILKLIETRGSDCARIKDRFGQSLLHTICYNNYVELIEPLLKCGIDINVKDNFKSTPIFNACKLGSIEIVKKLLEYEVNINVKDAIEQTPLYYGCRSENIELIELLLDYGSDAEILHNLIHRIVKYDKDGRVICDMKKIPKNTRENITKFFIEYSQRTANIKPAKRS